MVVVQVLWEIVKQIAITVWELMMWFYFNLVPFIVMYFGIPLFILGILMGISFSGGSLIIMIAFFVAMFFFIKKSVFHNPF